MAKYRVSVKYKTKSSTNYTNTSVTKEAETEANAMTLAVNEVSKRANVIEAIAISAAYIKNS